MDATPQKQLPAIVKYLRTSTAASIVLALSTWMFTYFYWSGVIFFWVFLVLAAIDILFEPDFRHKNYLRLILTGIVVAFLFAFNHYFVFVPAPLVVTTYSGFGNYGKGAQIDGKVWQPEWVDLRVQISNPTDYDYSDMDFPITPDLYLVEILTKTSEVNCSFLETGALDIQQTPVSPPGPTIESQQRIEPEGVQRFLMSLRVAPKTVRNILVTLQIMWKSARAWKYVSHDVTEGASLPQRIKPKRRHFTVEEIHRILLAADEPLKTFYWLAGETGMRAGELCALRGEDVHSGHVHVRQSVWRGKFGEPKTENAVRAIKIPPSLVTRLGELGNGLLFHTRKGTPWDPNLLVKRKLYPLLDSLGIARGGLRAFRHANASIMDALAVPMKVRQQRLGHSDISLTMNAYTHVASEADSACAEQIAGVLWPNVANSKEKGLTLVEQAL